MSAPRRTFRTHDFAVEVVELLRPLLDLFLGFVDLLRQVIKLPHEVALNHGILMISNDLLTSAHLCGTKLLPLVDLGLLVLEVLDFGEHATLLGVVGVGSLGSLLLRQLRGLILRSEFERADVS